MHTGDFCALVAREAGRHEGFPAIAPAACIYEAVACAVILCGLKDVLSVTCLMEIDGVITARAVYALGVHWTEGVPTGASFRANAVESPSGDSDLGRFEAFVIRGGIETDIIFDIGRLRGCITGLAVGMREDIEPERHIWRGDG